MSPGMKEEKVPQGYFLISFPILTQPPAGDTSDRGACVSARERNKWIRERKKSEKEGNSMHKALYLRRHMSDSLKQNKK